MGEVTTIELDLAKHVFQVHGIDAAGQVMVRRQLRRGELLKFFETPRRGEAIAPASYRPASAR
jgi:transposase